MWIYKQFWKTKCFVFQKINKFKKQPNFADRLRDTLHNCWKVFETALFSDDEMCRNSYYRNIIKIPSEKIRSYFFKLSTNFIQLLFSKFKFLVQLCWKAN